MQRFEVSHVKSMFMLHIIGSSGDPWPMWPWSMPGMLLPLPWSMCAWGSILEVGVVWILYSV